MLPGSIPTSKLAAITEWFTSRRRKAFGAFPEKKPSTSPTKPEQSNMEILWEMLDDVPTEYHSLVVWYLIGSFSLDTDSDIWKGEIKNAIRYVRGIAG